jgi:hypothetical protein
MYAAYRPAGPGETYFRFSHFAFPFWTMFPDGDFEDNIVAQAYVPMDDTHTMVFSVFYARRAPAMRRLKDGSPIPGLEPDANLQPMQLLPNSGDWFGRFRTALNKSNDYLIDRDIQAASSYTGISTVPIQDQAMVEGMGDIVDRTMEHLAPSDRMVTLTRRRLIRAARALQAQGIAPPALENPKVCHGARSGSFTAPNNISWLQAYTSQIKMALNPTGVLQAAE